ncbi:kinase-like domain-containing protein [Radiomyces spectabilis]|uniref:kinase-like domain-containing protein n=1 Tax=Radiomyces spectabilis TaxID=64574 RepID=UPI002220ED15|nr:kinase-like domain-containing protein [Radiomyces spectabilis]KAI8365319.1 kinase-like domain-containing protein [Radiomyces spectabilis]
MRRVHHYIARHPEEFVSIVHTQSADAHPLDLKPSPNDAETWIQLLTLDQDRFLEGWASSSQNAYQQLFEQYFDQPVAIARIVQDLQSSAKQPLIWFPPAWFQYQKSMVSGRKGPVYRTRCHAPWGDCGITLRQLHVPLTKCPQETVGITAFEQHLMLVSYTATNLEEAIAQMDQRNFKMIYRMALLMAGAVRDLHRENRVHPNLQPRNFFLQPNRETMALVDTDDLPTTAKGLIYGRWPYIAPEQCQLGGPTTYEANIYSLGIMLWQLVSGVVFPSHIRACPQVFSLCRFKNITPAYESIYLRCLSSRPEMRPSAEDVSNELVSILMDELAIGRVQSRASRSISDVRERQMVIARFFARCRSTVAKEALDDMVRGAPAGKRSVILMAASLERRLWLRKCKQRKPSSRCPRSIPPRAPIPYEKSWETLDSQNNTSSSSSQHPCGFSLGDMMQIGYA